MYIQVGNNQGFTLKDAEVSGAVEKFFSEIKFDVSDLENVLGKIVFCFDTRFNVGLNGLIKVSCIIDHQYIEGDELSFPVIKKQFIRFAEALKDIENKTANNIFYLFQYFFKNVHLFMD